MRTNQATTPRPEPLALDCYDIDAQQLALLSLNTYRLERDLSWEMLVAKMAEHGIVVLARTLQTAARSGRATDRTIYKIRKFLRAVNAPLVHP